MRSNPNDTWTSDALAKGDFQAIRERVAHDPSYLTSRDFIGNSPLLSAVGFGNLELVEFLLQQGADPNVCVDDGYTCLLTAVESDRFESASIVEALLLGGADIHKTGTNGWTALHMAAAHGYLEKAQMLLKSGAEVNRRTEIDGGDTPLMEAACGRHPTVVQLLLDHGADSSVRNWINE